MATTTINVTTSIPDLQQVTDVNNRTTNNIILLNSAIELDNGSKLTKGWIDNGADGGIARECAVNYQDQWENGVQYFINQGGFIVWANSINGSVPDVNFDITMGYVVGSIFHDMNNQDKYQCTDNTDGAAVWVPFYDATPDLQAVTDVGALTTNPIYVGDLSTAYSEISGGAVGTSNVNNGTYAYIGQDGILGLHNGDVESQLKNTNVSSGNNVVLEFPDKPSNSYTIATIDDIPTIPLTNAYGLFSQTANSTTITATTLEGTLIDGGVGTLTVPANAFKVGDSFRVDMGGAISAQNNDTIRIRLKGGAAIDLGDSGPLTMPSINNQVWMLSVNFTIRAIGAAGVANIVSLAQFHILKKASGTQQGFAWNTVNSTTFDTTISNTLNITAQFSSNNANNKIYSDIFTLTKVY